MKRSRAELAAQLMKAARGAMLELALAEDLYQIASFVTAEDVEWIAADIGVGGQGLKALTQDLDRIACGEELDVSTPLAPAMAAARGWVLEDGRKSDLPVSACSGPLEVSDPVWATLDHFAHKTYVPESEASRARGAGAGAIDND